MKVKQLESPALEATIATGSGERNSSWWKIIICTSPELMYPGVIKEGADPELICTGVIKELLLQLHQSIPEQLNVDRREFADAVNALTKFVFLKYQLKCGR
ncbi:hypothetical protein Tco_1394792 [Tanacetum coccineum]